MMGTTAAFDIGNVLVHFDITKFTSKLSEVTKISDDEALFFLEHIQQMQDIGVTSVSAGLRHSFKLNSSDTAELLDAWNKTITPSEMMLNYLGNLRHEGCKIALLSNMGPEHIEYLRSFLPEIFDKSIQHISCEVGARKPSKLFFQSFIDHHDEFSGSVYVDDIEENLRSGKKYGFTVYKLSLDDISKLSHYNQKVELNKLSHMIFNRT